jgi:murein DD-endopeptidase MepM/ murein hydrolase activator NlpD
MFITGKTSWVAGRGTFAGLRTKVAGAVAALTLVAIANPWVFAQSPGPDGQGGASYPTVNAPNPISSGDGSLNPRISSIDQGDGSFGSPRDGGRTHTGVDLTAPVGTPVQSRVDGRVTQSIVYPPPYSTATTPPATVVPPTPPNGAGNRVTVLGNDGHCYSDWHLDGQNQPTVGQRVVAGQVIGDVGRSGNVPPLAESHLHHEVRYRAQSGDRGVPLDPNVPRTSAPDPAPSGSGGGQLMFDDNAPRQRTSYYSYDNNSPRTSTSGYSPSNAPTPDVSTPAVTRRQPGTQSPTAALRFPR